MGWQENSRATNAPMSNYPYVSCWIEEIPLGCLLEKRVKSSGLVEHTRILDDVRFLNPMQYPSNNM